jgi:hypothetical protein
MMNAGMILGWKNSQGGYTISDRISRALTLPVPIETESQVVGLRVPAPSWATLAVTVFRPLDTENIKITSTSDYLYALGQRAPRNVDDPKSPFSIHNLRGNLGNVDLTTPQKPSIVAPPPATPDPGPPVPPVTSASSTCIPNTFCVYSERSENGEMVLTIHSAAGGWASLGIGASMENAIMIVGWRNSQGGITLSDRRSTDRSMPRPLRTISKLLELKVPAPAWANLAFTFSRPLDAADARITAETVFIYGYSTTPPTQPDDPNSNFAIHTGRGNLGRLDVSKVQNVDPPSGKVGERAVPDAKSVCVPSQFCFFGELDGNGNVYLTVHSAAEGWASLGIGASMDNAHMIVGWRNSSGGITISDRFSTDRVLPPVVTTSSVQVPLRVASPSWAKTAFTILRPLSFRNAEITPDTTYIYASASQRPSQLDNAASSFVIHDVRGSLGRVDLTSPPSGSDIPSDGTIDTKEPGSGVSSTCIPGKFCVYSDPDGKGNVIVTIHSAGNGWASIGTHVNMRNSAMTVGWRNSSGGIVVSDRFSTSDTLPPMSEQQLSEVMPLAKEAPSWATLAFSYKRPIVSKEVTFTPNTEFIYAYGTRAPTEIDNPRSSFAIHSERGRLGPLDFTRKGDTGSVDGSQGSLLPLPSWLTYSQVITFHGYMMMLAWTVAPALGIFVARYLKSNSSWFKIHILLMLIGVGICSTIAMIPVILFKTGPHFSTLPNVHPLLGLMITIALFAQLILGVVSDKLFEEDRAFIPWWDKLHWWVGRALSLLSQGTIILGILIASIFDAYSIAMPVVYALILVSCIVLFWFGESRFGPQRILD